MRRAVSLRRTGRDRLATITWTQAEEVNTEKNLEMGTESTPEMKPMNGPREDNERDLGGIAIEGENKKRYCATSAGVSEMKRGGGHRMPCRWSQSPSTEGTGSCSR